MIRDRNHKFENNLESFLKNNNQVFKDIVRIRNNIVKII